MYPYLFGWEKLPTYGVLLALGLLGALLIFKFICAKRKVDDDTYGFYSLLGIVSIALGLIGAYVFQAIYNGIYNAVNHLSGAAKKTGGLTFMGGLVTGVLTYVVGTILFAKGKVKRNFFEVASYAAPAIVLGHLFGRLGCFCAGCCYGKPTDGPLGVHFPDMYGKVLPTQLFEAIFLAILLAVMLVLIFRFDKVYILLPLYGFSYGVWRFILEFFRGDYRGVRVLGMYPSQIQSIVLVLVATALVICVYGFHILPFAHAPDPAPKATGTATGETSETAESPDEPNIMPDESADNATGETTDAPTESSPNEPTESAPDAPNETAAESTPPDPPADEKDPA